MLHLLDETLESMLRAEVPQLRDVGVSFDVPDDTWRAGVTKPTVNVFLYDVRRNADRQQSGWTMVDTDRGRARREPTNHVDCRYLVTVWTAEVADQHQLLGALLAALLEAGPISEEHLAGPLADVEPVPVMSAAWPTEREPFEFWTALGGQLRPGIELTVTLAVDRRVMVDVGPPVTRVVDMVAPFGGDAEPSERVGGRSAESPKGTVVWTSRGADRVDGTGAVLVAAAAGDTVWVAEPTLAGLVPEEGAVAFDEGDAS